MFKIRIIISLPVTSAGRDFAIYPVQTVWVVHLHHSMNSRLFFIEHSIESAMVSTLIVKNAALFCLWERAAFLDCLSAEQSAQQGDKGRTDQGDTAAGHELLNALGFRTG